MYASFPRLLADVGGTHARFAWQDRAGAPLTLVRTLHCAEHDSLELALLAYLTEIGRAMPPCCAIGIATPVLGDHVSMTNHRWAFSIEELRRQLGLERLKVVNDFTALALSLPLLAPHDVRQIGGGDPQRGAAIGLLGPGTGLGVSGLLPSGSGWTPLQGEGGHVSLAPANRREAAVLDWVRERHGHASAERLVSGPGLKTLHQALCALDRQPDAQLPAALIVERGLSGEDPGCREALELFCAFLGSTAGDLALTLGARGGVYIGGGIVPRLGAWFDGSPFRARFEAKGRFQDYLRAIPVQLIVATTSPALLGAGQALDLLG